MQLRDQLESDGDWLFQNRSFVPLLLIPVLISALIGPPHSHRITLITDSLGCLLAALGLLIRAVVVGFIPPGTSGRNMRTQRAAVLNTTGLYSLVRHPLYVGNFFVAIGWCLASASGWMVVVTALLFILYYERIALREEAFLRSKFGDDFTAWTNRVPACLPRSWRWTPSDRVFDWGMTIRREYQTVCLIVAGFVTVHLLRAALIPGDTTSPTLWVAVGLIDACLFSFLWIIIKLRRSRLREAASPTVRV